MNSTINRIAFKFTVNDEKIFSSHNVIIYLLLSIYSDWYVIFNSPTYCFMSFKSGFDSHTGVFVIDFQLIFKHIFQYEIRKLLLFFLDSFEHSDNFQKWLSHRHSTGTFNWDTRIRFIDRQCLLRENLCSRRVPVGCRSSGLRWIWTCNSECYRRLQFLWRPRRKCNYTRPWCFRGEQNLNLSRISHKSTAGRRWTWGEHGRAVFVVVEMQIARVT